MTEHEPYKTADEASPDSDNEKSQADSGAQQNEFAEQPAATHHEIEEEGEGTGARAGEYS